MTQQVRDALPAVREQLVRTDVPLPSFITYSKIAYSLEIGESCPVPDNETRNKVMVGIKRKFRNEKRYYVSKTVRRREDPANPRSRIIKQIRIFRLEAPFKS